MTLILTPGEDLLSSSSSNEDQDKSCPSSVPDSNKNEVHLTKIVKRVSLTEIESSRLEKIEDEDVSISLAGSSQSDPVQYQSDVQNGTQEERKETSDSNDTRNVQNGVTSLNSSPDSSNSNSSSSTVGYPQCITDKEIIPGVDADVKHELEGPALVSSPQVLLASQVRDSDEIQSLSDSYTQQTSACVIQLRVSGDNNSSLTGDNGRETKAHVYFTSSGNCSENGDLGSTCVSSVNGTDVSPYPGEVRGEDEEGRASGTGHEQVDNSIAKESPNTEEKAGDSSCHEGRGTDIHEARQKINLLRQNFLSSLSADDDGVQPDFVLLPYHVDGNYQKQPERNQEGTGRVEGLCPTGGISNNENDDGSLSNFTEEVGNREWEVVEAVSGVEGSASASATHLLNEPLNCHTVPSSASDNAADNALQNNPTAENTRTPRVENSSDNLILLLDHSPSKYGRQGGSCRGEEGTSNTSSASRAVIAVDGSGNMSPGCDITPTPTLETGDEAECSRSLGNPPAPSGSQLPPTPPSSPPTPPSSPPRPSPSSPSASSPPTPPSSPHAATSRMYLKGHSANLVNMLMYQSRKHKRLHRLRVTDEGVVDYRSVNNCQTGVVESVPGSEYESHSPNPPTSSAQPPQRHGNLHVEQPTANTHCGTTEDQLCHPSTQLPVGGLQPLHRPLTRTNHHLHALSHNTQRHNNSVVSAVVTGEPIPSDCDAHVPAARDSGEILEKCQSESFHGNECLSEIRTTAVARVEEKDKRNPLLLPSLESEGGSSTRSGSSSGGISQDDQRLGSSGTTSELGSSCESRDLNSRKNFTTYCDIRVRKSDRNLDSSYDDVFENDSCVSESSCLDYLTFEHEGDGENSDNEFDTKQKNRLSEACKDIARALNSLPGSAFHDQVLEPATVATPRYRDQEVEAHLSDTDCQLDDEETQTRVKTCGTNTASDEDRRGSLYDNCGQNGSSCECGHCHTSDAEEEPLVQKQPPSSSSVALMMEKWQARRRRDNESYSCGSDYELEDEGFRTDAGEGCRTDEFDASCTTSDDNDYDDDYCQTDDCGEECDYCSGDDAEDEAEDTCYYCKHTQILSPVCKHPGVITNGILKSFSGRRSQGQSDSTRAPRQRSLALQAAIHRRRLTRRGLVAIRESSITSDDLPDSEEEKSFDGSNCDISSSWKFGLCRDLTAASRDSTLRSVRSERSSSSLPIEKARQKAKEKSNSLPGANSRSFVGDLPVQLTAEVTTPPGRLASTSEEESGSHGSLPRLPPRLPRAPRMRPPLTPSPPTIINMQGLPPPSPNSPRPAMGLQGLQQQRSPNTSRALHVSGLPVAPRTVAPRSPSNPNPPYGFPAVSNGSTLMCPGSPGLAGRSTPSPGASEAPPASPRINTRAGALVTRNFSISDDEGGARWSGGRRHVTITRHESVYREVAEKGYHLPPGSPVDPYWLTWKLGVLQKTVEDVSGRLEEAEKTVEGWGPLSQDPNLADQHAHNVRKFREGLAELQRGVDDVNDQAARFSAHNVPLTPANSAKLHDLNNRWKSLETTVNDRWRQVAGRSREVTPLTPAQLASSVSPPWERATTSNKVPYYINHDQENTHWDHPVMMDLLDSLTEFNHIKFSAYRTAMKLRMLQKKLALDCAKMQMATDIFDEHGLRGQNDRLIDVGDMVVVLSALYANISADHPEVDTTLAMDLCLNWLLNVYDSQRTGQMRVLSFKIGLVCLCSGHLEEKYRYMFRLIADPNRLVDQRKLGLLLHDCVQVPRQLGEVAAFGGSNIEPSVRSCFTKAGKDRDTIEALHFLAWVQQEPQSLVWLAVLHRVAASETIQHQVKCNICKAYPILGLRYRCLKCLSFDMCQRCFFDGRSGKSHKITHPMHEYCTATTAGEDVKDFTKALKNKFKSKRSLQKHTKKGYLPVQSVLEGDPLESPSPSPQHNVTSQDMHSRLELYASRLAEVELRTNSNSTPDSEDEHGLIAQYCQSLSSSDAPLPVPRSPLQIMAAVDAEQKDELEQMIRALEEENSVLQAEYDRLKSQQPVGSPPDDGLSGQRSEADMLAEAKLLRQHKGRLEARMGILEEHNRQLEAQLHRLRQLLGEPGGVSSPNKSGTLQTKSVTASQLAMDSPAKVNGHSTQAGASSTYEGLEQMSEYVRPPPPPMGNVAHVGNLFSRAAPYRSSGWRPGEGSWHSGGHNDPRGGERLA